MAKPDKYDEAAAAWCRQITATASLHKPVALASWFRKRCEPGQPPALKAENERLLEALQEVDRVLAGSRRVNSQPGNQGICLWHQYEPCQIVHARSVIAAAKNTEPPSQQKPLTTGPDS